MKEMIPLHICYLIFERIPIALKNSVKNKNQSNNQKNFKLIGKLFNYLKFICLYQLEDDSGQFLVRPYAEAFLEEMAHYFEIVIFTAALQDYADYILDIIDNKKCISYRLYRKHTTPQNSIYRKVSAMNQYSINKLNFPSILGFVQDRPRS